MTTGKRLKKAREYLRLSQDYVGEYLGVSSSEIKSIESGNRDATQDELEQFSKLYGVDVDELLHGEKQIETNLTDDDLKGLNNHDKQEVIRLAKLQKTWKKDQAKKELER